MLNRSLSTWWCSDAGRGSRALMLSSLAFSLMTVCVKQLGGRIPIAEVVLCRALISVALTGIGLALAGVSPWGHRKVLLIIRGLCGSIALLCFFEAITTLPLASATVLQYTYPTFTALAAALFLREHLRPGIAVAVLIGWFGITLVSQPEWLQAGTTTLPVRSVLIALAGALFTALAYVSVRRLSTSEHPLVIILYFPMISIPLTLPFVMQNGVWPIGSEWIWLVGVGTFTQLGQIWVTRGLSLMAAARATSINYVQVVFAALWGWIFFSETLNLWILTGGLLILASTLISLASREKKTTSG